MGAEESKTQKSEPTEGGNLLPEGGHLLPDGGKLSGDGGKLSGDVVPVSKKSLKRALKREDWEVKKKVRRAAERAKAKEKRKEDVLNGVAKKGYSRRSLKWRKVDYKSPTMQVAIDLSFEDLMDEKAIGKCIKQLLRAYTLNRRAVYPSALYFCGLEKAGKQMEILQKHDGFMHWDVKIESDSIYTKFDKSRLVYLTSESENVLTSLNNEDVYVIGGLVDYNKLKGICHKVAIKQGIRHARLPITEYFVMKTRVVLTIDQVFEIMLHVSEGKNWQEALQSTIPQRKQAIPIDPDYTADDDISAYPSSDALVNQRIAVPNIERRRSKSDQNSADSNTGFEDDTMEEPSDDVTRASEQDEEKVAGLKTLPPPSVLSTTALQSKPAEPAPTSDVNMNVCEESSLLTDAPIVPLGGCTTNS